MKKYLALLSLNYPSMEARFFLKKPDNHKNCQMDLLHTFTLGGLGVCNVGKENTDSLSTMSIFSLVNIDMLTTFSFGVSSNLSHQKSPTAKIIDIHFLGTIGPRKYMSIIFAVGLF